jgi:hypothetical protein
MDSHSYHSLGKKEDHLSHPSDPALSLEALATNVQPSHPPPAWYLPPLQRTHHQSNTIQKLLTTSALTALLLTPLSQAVQLGIVVYSRGDCMGSNTNSGSILSGHCFNFAHGGNYGAQISSTTRHVPCTWKFWANRDCSGKATVFFTNGYDAIDGHCTAIGNKNGALYLTGGAASVYITCS